MNSSEIVQKLWNYCTILRDDGLSYGDYPSAESILSATEGLRTGAEQLTYLLFLKMADERIVGLACMAASKGSATGENVI